MPSLAQETRNDPKITTLIIVSLTLTFTIMTIHTLRQISIISLENTTEVTSYNWLPSPLLTVSTFGCYGFFVRGNLFWTFFWLVVCYHILQVFYLLQKDLNLLIFLAQLSLLFSRLLFEGFIISFKDIIIFPLYFQSFLSLFILFFDRLRVIVKVGIWTL